MALKNDHFATPLLMKTSLSVLKGPRIHQPKVDLFLPTMQTQTSIPVKTEPNFMNNSLNSSKQPNKKSSKNNESYVTHGVQLLTYINELNKIKEIALARRERGLPG